MRHVTYLSEYGGRQFPPDAGPRAVELDLIGRGKITHSILRPAWFMQNFSEGFLYPVEGVISVPTGDGLEAFIDVDDIAREVWGQPHDWGRRSRPIRGQVAHLDGDHRLRNGCPSKRRRREGHRPPADQVC